MEKKMKGLVVQGLYQLCCVCAAGAPAIAMIRWWHLLPRGVFSLDG